MAFLYETHLHTCEGSSCGVSHGQEYIKKYLDLGYTGVIITDHFFNGNCRADRNLPWGKWVEAQCRGYERARAEGARRGLDVFFGWEETINGGDYLVYGLDKEWLLEHPEAADWDLREQFETVGRCGGCVVHAHPYRYGGGIAGGTLPSAGYVDAVEVANSGNQQICDAMAYLYAKEIHVPGTAGSDIHYAGDIRPNTVFGVYLDRKMETIADYVHAVKNNAISGLKIPRGRCQF